MPAIETFVHKGKTVEIHADEDPPNPRKDMDNLGTILYVSDRYTLGDKKMDPYEISSIVSEPGVISLNVYTLIHSGIAMKTTPFDDKWDSGQSGVIYTTEKEALKWFQRKRMTPKLRAKVLAALRAEVKVYGEYANGEVYGYVILDENGEHVDSLWGMWDYDYVKSEAKKAAASA